MMKLTSKCIVTGAACLALASLGGPAARATDLLNDPADSITAANSTVLLGNRYNPFFTQQTWDPAVNGSTSYFGVTARTKNTGFNYLTYTFTAAQLGDGQYVQISLDEPLAGDLFASAWTTFNGQSSLASGDGWLGDEAGRPTGNYSFGGAAQDPKFFNVTVPAGSGLTVVLDTTSPSALGEQYGIDIEAFSSKDYTDAALGAVPEPSTWAMLGAGALLGVAVVRRQRRIAHRRS